jgi:membrane associated rhomboid family serine protease
MIRVMELAPPTPEPTAATIARDRARLRYALLGAGAWLAGIWLVWFGAWCCGWDLRDLGIRPREAFGLIGILTAPLVHASFAHLMANTLPLGLLATLTLYAYPRAARLALPCIWLASGLGVWIWGRPSVHLGSSGLTHGLMFFLFVSGLLRRDRLGVAIALVVFFLYGGMVLTVLPREPDVSFEYHLFGALAGLFSALAGFRLDPCPPRRRYSWEDEDTASPVPLPSNAAPIRPAAQPVNHDAARGPGSGTVHVVPFPQHEVDRPTPP